MATEPLSYVDSSALAKLVVTAHETGPLERHLRGRRMASSELAIVEVSRAEKRVEALARSTARSVLAEVDLVALTRGLLERAADATSEELRSLNAIHLATALEIDPDDFVAYDQRLLEAAMAAGLRTASPR